MHQACTCCHTVCTLGGPCRCLHHTVSRPPAAAPHLSCRCLHHTRLLSPPPAAAPHHFCRCLHHPVSRPPAAAPHHLCITSCHPRLLPRHTISARMRAVSVRETVPSAQNFSFRWYAPTRSCTQGWVCGCVELEGLTSGQARTDGQGRHCVCAGGGRLLIFA